MFPNESKTIWGAMSTEGIGPLYPKVKAVILALHLEHFILLY